ncbi:bacterio-opsin activator domain-containing protein [Halopelagius fulvigenes]|uniref:Bacterio-opsin activator domain-containing protein n=1 Tax=Halopelagius fulvigenes TaxID=1198324 RepID=A0ABD5U176_9EURY
MSTSTIAVVRIPSSEFALSDTFDRCPDVEFDIERLVARDSDSAMPFMWAQGTDLDAVEDALREDSSVAEFEVLANLGDERLYRMSWVAHIRLVIHILLEEEGTILDAHGRGGNWRLRIMFPERDSLSATYDFCSDHGLSFDVEKVYDMNESARAGRFGLSEEQFDALTTAAEHGYFQVPRGVTAEELGEMLGITHQSLSERLRRGQENLIRSTLLIDDPDVE